jgi:hypothetical protein
VAAGVAAREAENSSRPIYTHKDIIMPGQKFGRIRPAILPSDHQRMLQFEDYMKSGILMDAPASCNWSSAVKVPYGEHLNAGKGAVGDCTVADIFNRVIVWPSNCGRKPVILPDSLALSTYSAISGYVPGNESTDTGCIISDVEEYFQKKGIGGYKSLGSASVRPTNLNNVRWACYLLGGVTMGFEVPESALEQNDQGKIWDVVPMSPIAGGHDVLIVDYDGESFTCVTWGGLQRMTIPFFKHFCQEIWGTADELWIDERTDLAPSKLRIASLITDMGKLAA